MLISRPRRSRATHSTTIIMARGRTVFARMQMTIRNGRRESAATAYLHPVLARDNLTVQVNCHVTHIVIEGARAVGVE